VRALATVVVVAGLAGCSSGSAGTLLLSWKLADGRDCYTAGAVAVQARTSPSLDSMPLDVFACTDGAAPRSVSIDGAPGSGTLYLDARSSETADLYHGALSLDDNSPGTGELRTVTLYAVAAE
jgi:hypothetical protein